MVDGELLGAGSLVWAVEAGMYDFSGAAAEPDSSRVPLYAGMPIADGSGPLVQTSGAARSSASFPRVLWIDDEIDSDDAAVRLMKFEGIDVDCAQSGIAGL